MQQVYHLRGKVTSANVGERFDDLATLKDIKDFAEDHQPVICQLPRITIQGPAIIVNLLWAASRFKV